MRWLILLACLALAACGGGGSSAPQAPAHRAGIDFGYYWTAEGQIAATAAHVTFVHVHDGGDWDTPLGREAIIQRQIAQMQEARARGVDRFYLSTGFLTFTRGYQYRGIADLAAYRGRLDALDLSRSVVALFPLDEPDMLGVPDVVMTRAISETRAAWAGPKLLVTYGDHGTPGIAAADWIGHDDYPAGPDVLKRLPKIRADQSYVLLAGGANPWRADPQPFVSFAFADPRVVALWAFMYGDRRDPDGTLQLGIGANGMAPAYTAVGISIRSGG